MSRVPRRVATAVTALALVAPAAAAADVAPRLDLGSMTGAPFPSDRWTVEDPSQITGRRVALPKPDCAARPNDCQDLDVINELDGFNLQPRVSIPFTGAIDVSSVSSDTIFFVRLSAGEGVANVVGIDQVVWDPATDTLHAESDELLDQHTTYALVVTTGVRDASGRRIDDDRFRQKLNYGKTKSRSAKAYRKQLLDALKIVRARTGTKSSDVASVSVFTTQSATANMEKIRRQLDAAGPSAARFDLGPGAARTVFPFPTVGGITFNRQVTAAGALSPAATPAAALNVYPGAVGTVAFGTYESPNYLTSGGYIPQVGTATGVPMRQSTTTVAFNLVLPSGPQPAGGWPVAVFGHGFGDNKNSSPFVVASTMARAGIATIAINVVGHGFGPGGTLTVNRTGGAPPVTFAAGGRAVDQNGDGTFESTEGVNATAPRTIIASRDGLNQTVIDLMALVRTIKGGVDVDADGAADLSRARVYYFGQSFGGIYGTELLGLDPEVRTGVPNVPGGPIIEVARLGAFRPLVAATLGARTPSLLNGGPSGFTESIPLRGAGPITAPAPGATAIQTLIDNTEWVSQSSNPVVWARHLRLAPLEGVPAKNVIIQFARGDATVPNPTTTAMIRAGRLEDRTTVFRNDLARAADPTLPANPHTFLTRIVGSTAGAARIAAQAQDQIATFFTSDGTTTIDPDGSGALFETPIQMPLPEDRGF